ncbi:hypothetical protein HDU96_005638 [Phlyctochytrium bullatum]|nr:hypothetical protein HDU96_005638 [Phlyctochytrium bullatum]
MWNAEVRKERMLSSRNVEARIAAKLEALEPRFEDVLINEQMRLFYFGNPLGQNTNLPLPNRMALAYHKRCCLVWKISGGSQEYTDISDDKEEESNDEVEADHRAPYYEYDHAKKMFVADWCGQVEDSRATAESDAIKDPMERTESDKTLDSPMA